MGARVRKRKHALEVVGHGLLTPTGTILSEPRDHILMGTLEGTGPAYLRSLQQALVGWRRKMRTPFVEDSQRDRARVWIGISQYTESDFQRRLDDDPDSHWITDLYTKTPPTSPAILLEGDRLYVRIAMWRPEEEDATVARRLLAPYLERFKASCEVTMTPVEEYEGDGFTLTVDLDRPYPSGATVADAWKFGDEAQALLEVVEGDEIPRPLALDLICAGRWDLFYGQPESDWLEAKGAPYDHLIGDLGQNWRFELAKDVAALANSPEGGIIVIGMITKDRGDGDIIRGHKEFDLSRVRGPSYRRHISQLVYPSVVGFEVKRIEGSTKGHGLVALVIPPQSESSRPFLVQGVLSQKKLLGSYVLLPVRRGDDTALMDSGALHARIRLGEQVIAGEQQAR